MIIDFDGYIFVGAVLVWGLLVLFLKLKLKKSLTYIFFFSIFYIYLCKVLDYTQFPIILNEETKRETGQNVWRDANLIPFHPQHFAVKTSLLNVLLTIPFGFGLPFIAKVNWKRISTLGVLLGVSLEMFQLVIALFVGFTFRYVDINDVIFNFCGVIFGYGTLKAFMIVFRFLVHKMGIRLNPFLRYIYEIE